MGKLLDLVRELWNKKMMVTSVVVGTMGMVPKGLAKRLGELEIRRGIETNPDQA